MNQPATGVPARQSAPQSGVPASVTSLINLLTAR
jgi:hypothetical protein